PMRPTSRPVRCCRAPASWSNGSVSTATPSTAPTRSAATSCSSATRTPAGWSRRPSLRTLRSPRRSPRDARSSGGATSTTRTRPAVSERRSNAPGRWGYRRVRVLMARAGLSFGERSEISTASKAGWGVRRIARHLGRCPSVVSREIRRNTTKTRGYQAVTADVAAQRRRARPQQRKVARDRVLKARVEADLAASWTPNEIAGRLRLEAADPTVGRMANSPDAQGRTVSGEAIYQYIYAIPKGELA